MPSKPSRKETQTFRDRDGASMQGWVLGVEVIVVRSRVIAEVVVQRGSWPREARQVGSLRGEERGHRGRMVYFLRAQVEGDKCPGSLIHVKVYFENFKIIFDIQMHFLEL